MASEPDTNLDEHELDDALPDIIEDSERLLNELNLLKLEGCLFCFDPKEAARRSGTRVVEQVERFQEVIKRPVRVEIHPNYGQPSVLAYKALQAVLKKATDEGWPIPDTISFGRRELGTLVGRATFGGRDSNELYRAIMQLRTTAIHASWYQKESRTWSNANLNVFITALFSASDTNTSTLQTCSVQLHPFIVKSLNDKHFACLNWTRMQGLDPIGMALYKRLAFHFANLLSSLPRNRRERLLYHRPQAGGELLYEKDYEAILAEWLGGLKPAKYKATILRDQLGRHLEGLRKARLIQRYELEKRADGDGWKIRFYAGRGFFADYEAFYLREWQPQLRLQQTADRRNIEQPLELVALFHRHLGHDQNTFEPQETRYASKLLDQHSFEEVRAFVEFAVGAMRETGFDKTARLFTAAKQYEAAWRTHEDARERRTKRNRRIEECLLCDQNGFLLVQTQDGSRYAVKCRHDPAWLKTVLDEKKWEQAGE